MEKSKYFLYIAVAFVAVLLVSNTVAVKIFSIGPLVLNGGIIVFPVSYIFGDVLTEVYGYKATRKIIWSGFAALAFMAAAYFVVQLIPPAPFWGGESAYKLVLGTVPRIVLGSMAGYFSGEFVNSYVMSKMKIWTSGKILWLRIVSSTIFGEGVDTIIFSAIAFFGALPNNTLLVLMASSFTVKVLYEICATPLTYSLVNYLKKAEGIDIYDHGVSYNPFTLS